MSKQEQPPERIWFQPFRRPVTWSTFKTTEIDVEYVRADLAPAGERVADSQRLDWLENVMRPADSYQEIYLAGLRRGNADADSFQCELQKHGSASGQTLRDAIDAARGLLDPKGMKG